MDIPLIAFRARLETRESSARLWLLRDAFSEREHSRVPSERRSDAGMRERAGELKVKRDVKRTGGSRDESERERVVRYVSRRGKQSASPWEGN